jgi:hypothetical protein
MPRDPFELLGEAAVDTVIGTFRTGMWLFRLGSRQRERKRVAQQAAADERASRQQRQEWLEEARLAKSRGQSGFASETEARAVLNGKGGRKSKLDGRKLR